MPTHNLDSTGSARKPAQEFDYEPTGSARWPTQDKMGSPRKPTHNYRVSPRADPRHRPGHPESRHTHDENYDGAATMNTNNMFCYDVGIMMRIHSLFNPNTLYSDYNLPSAMYTPNERSCALMPLTRLLSSGCMRPC